MAPNILANDPRFGHLAQLTTRLGDADLSTLLVYLVDQVDAGWPPALAEQFHVAGDEGWRLSQGARQQRELIKQSIHLHRSKGTRWSLQQVLATLALSGQISEWFEYAGKPYHFKIHIDLAARIAAATLTALEAMINEYKNARSVLELLALVLSNRSAVPVLALATGRRTGHGLPVPARIAATARQLERGAGARQRGNRHSLSVSDHGAAAAGAGDAGPGVRQRRDGHALSRSMRPLESFPGAIDGQ